jgi:hypothetical protein
MNRHLAVGIMARRAEPTRKHPCQRQAGTHQQRDTPTRQATEWNHRDKDTRYTMAQSSTIYVDGRDRPRWSRNVGPVYSVRNRLRRCKIGTT